MEVQSAKGMMTAGQANSNAHQLKNHDSWAYQEPQSGKKVPAKNSYTTQKEGISEAPEESARGLPRSLFGGIRFGMMGAAQIPFQLRLLCNPHAKVPALTRCMGCKAQCLRSQGRSQFSSACLLAGVQTQSLTRTCQRKKSATLHLSPQKGSEDLRGLRHKGLSQLPASKCCQTHI